MNAQTRKRIGMTIHSFTIALTANRFMMIKFLTCQPGSQLKSFQFLSFCWRISSGGTDVSGKAFEILDFEADWEKFVNRRLLWYLE